MGQPGHEPEAPPVATYRVQLNAGFDLDAAAGIATYLGRLGVSHLYCSPCLQAAPGSEHGYDVADPRVVNAELGGEAAYRRLIDSLARAGLKQVLDIVPNHMAVVPQNPWWWDVLEHGPGSAYARYFDVDWAAEDERRQNVVLLPVLGDHYGRELEAGRIRVEWADDALRVRYFDHVFPTAPGTADALIEAAGVDPAAPAALEAAIARANDDPDMLDALLDRQHYRLAYWRIASRELGYRRFFNIDTLIALRVERPEVFHDVHARVLAWLERGVLDGVRIDHIDGLYDPTEYLERLHGACRRAWVLVEKILEPGERLPDAWPIAGTTGYEFIYHAGGLFVDPTGEAPLTALYHDVVGEPSDYGGMLREAKHAALHALLGSDINRLTGLFDEVCARHRRYRDFTREELREALKEVAACFPVYRTYVRPQDDGAREIDRERIDEAVARAKRERHDIAPDLLDFLRDLLAARVRGVFETELAMRFQQLTGPAMAKGGEDTAFYRYHRLVALNEVGGAPDRFGVSIDDFHAHARERLDRHPYGLLATSTHDTKRAEDVRMRLLQLSEIPGVWRETVTRWFDRNERYKQGGWPDPNLEYLLYQTLVGAWPLDAERAQAYMLKAAREAKAHTDWAAPDTDYEQALAAFIAAVLADRQFTDELAQFVAPLIAPGRIASLGLVLLKLTAPGVPDLYRGTELWDLSLVDPDNRRPVDYSLRAALLDELDGLTAESVMARADEGLPKLWLIREGLRVRRERPRVFSHEGTYTPLRAAGRDADQVVAFVRGGEVISVVPRWALKRAGRPIDARLVLPDGAWRNVLTGDDVPGGGVQAAELLARFPVGLLVRHA